MRDPGYRRKSRMQRIKEYFYGIASDLTPHSTTINFRDFHIYKVGSSPVTAVKIEILEIHYHRVEQTTQFD